MKLVKFHWYKNYSIYMVKIYAEMSKLSDLWHFIFRCKFPYVKDISHTYYEYWNEGHYGDPCLTLKLDSRYDSDDRLELEKLVTEYLEHHHMVTIPRHHKKLRKFLPGQPSVVRASWWD